MGKSEHAIELLHSYNKKVVFNYIRVHDAISRSELSQCIGMSNTAITRIVNDFIAAGMVREVGELDADTVGRKPIMLSVCGDCMYALGVNIDIDELAMGCVDINGDIVYAARTREYNARDPESVVKAIARIYQDVLEHLTEEVKDNIVGMGVGVPGVIDWPKGFTRVTPQLHWEPFPLRERLREELDIEVLVDNNVKGIAAAESMFGTKREMEDFLVLEVGSGLGAAYVIDGRALRGATGILGEIGHSIVVEDGAICDCGRRGCLQAYTCITGMEKRLGMPIEEIMKRRGTDVQVQSVLLEAVHYLARTIANLNNYYNPGSVVLYGKLFEIWPELVDMLKQLVDKLMWRASNLKLQQSEIRGEKLRILAAASVLYNDVLVPEAMIRKSALQIEKRYS